MKEYSSHQVWQLIDNKSKTAEGTIEDILDECLDSIEFGIAQVKNDLSKKQRLVNLLEAKRRIQAMQGIYYNGCGEDD